MTPQPPKPTLFPYTTLFRSHTSTEESTRRRALPSPPRSARRRRQRDRKSTRLNSSHVEISYAVFCLKKKNFSIDSKQLIHCATSNSRSTTTSYRVTHTQPIS